MQTYNFFENQYVGVADLMALQTVPQVGIKDILVSLVNKGVISGVSVSQNTPSASLAVAIAVGHMILEDGSDVTTGTTTTLDLSSYVATLATGNSAWASIYACPVQVSDTPVITPSGTTINYRTYDSVQFLVSMGPVSTGTPSLGNTPPPGFTGVLLADVLLTAGQTQILTSNISTTRLNSFINFPYLISLIQQAAPPWPISDITGLTTALAALMPLNASIPQTQIVDLVANLAAINTALASLSSTLSSDMTGINAQLSTHTTQLSTLNSEMSTADSNISTLQSNVTSIQFTVAGHTTSIGSLNSEMSTADSNISTLQGQMSTADSNISTLQGQMSTADSNISTLQGQMSTADSNISSLQNFESAFTYGNNGNGYWEKMPNGRIRCWGQVTTDINAGTIVVTFPTAFTTASSISVTVTTYSITDRITYVVSGTVSTNGFTIANNGSGGYAMWEAVGY